MSLINDALKRAQRAQVEARPAQKIAPPLQPVVETRRSSRAFFALAAVGGIAALWLGLAYFWRADTGRLAQSGSTTRQDAPKPLARATTPSGLAHLAGAPEPVSTSETTRGSHLAQVPQQAVLPVPALSKVTISLQKQAHPAAQTPIQVAASEDSEPQLKLENIYFRLKRPSARINGKILYRGDRIGQARVIAIERHAVRLTVQGKTTTLEM